MPYLNHTLFIVKGTLHELLHENLESNTSELAAIASC